MSSTSTSSSSSSPSAAGSAALLPRLAAALPSRAPWRQPSRVSSRRAPWRSSSRRSSPRRGLGGGRLRGRSLRGAAFAASSPRASLAAFAADFAELWLRPSRASWPARPSPAAFAACLRAAPSRGGRCDSASRAQPSSGSSRVLTRSCWPGRGLGGSCGRLRRRHGSAFFTAEVRVAIEHPGRVSDTTKTLVKSPALTRSLETGGQRVSHLLSHIHEQHPTCATLIQRATDAECPPRQARASRRRRVGRLARNRLAARRRSRRRSAARRRRGSSARQRVLLPCRCRGAPRACPRAATAPRCLDLLVDPSRGSRGSPRAVVGREDQPVAALTLSSAASAAAGYSVSAR